MSYVICDQQRRRSACTSSQSDRLISTFFVRCLDSIIPLVFISEISRLLLASEAEQADLSLPWSQTPKTGFLVSTKCYRWKRWQPTLVTTARYSFEPPHDETNKLTWAPSDDSDQPGDPPSLISGFAVRMKKALVLSYPLSAQRRLWSDWADAQADLSLRCVHIHFVGFVIRRIILFYKTLWSCMMRIRQLSP